MISAREKMIPKYWRVKRSLINKFFPDKLLKGGIANDKTISTKNMEIKLKNTDSPKNWKTMDFLDPPIDFLNPTSFARLVYWAVERFMKFMQAISIRVRTMMESRYSVLIFPPGSSSPSSLEERWMSSSG